MQAQLDGGTRNRPIYKAIAREHAEAGYDRIEGDEADSGATPTTTTTNTNAPTPITTSTSTASIAATSTTNSTATSTTSIAATSTTNSDTGGQSSSSRNVNRPQSRGTRIMAVRLAGAKRGTSDTLLLLLAEMEERAYEIAKVGGGEKEARISNWRTRGWRERDSMKKDCTQCSCLYFNR